jgi:DNA (cytosine-5)-methyltransferase 1
MATYFNEFDPFAAQWLRNLIAVGHLPPGVVDGRDIREVSAADVGNAAECHWFAGIGGWAHALRLAGWPATRPVWTASLPCQPFSSAGRRKGRADERHLWPVFLRLVRDGRPPVCLGEQVASDDGYRWLARVRDDLEAAGYAVGAADLCAAGAGAPHVRQRLFWVAIADCPGRWSARQEVVGAACFGRPLLVGPSIHGRLGDAVGAGRQGRGAGVRGRPDHRPDGRPPGPPGGRAGGLVAADGRQPGDGGLPRGGQHRQQPEDGGAGGGVDDAADDGLDGDHPHPRPGESRQAAADPLRPGIDFWSDCEWLPCSDGKARRTQPGLQPLVDGAPFRLADGRTGSTSRAKALRGIGNAIVPQVAALFVRAFLEAEEELAGAV